MEAEPTRSVLHRSAATLAVQCGELQQAEKLIAVALAGQPPLDVAEELKDSFIQIYLQRYLERKGVQLADDSVVIVDLLRGLFNGACPYNPTHPKCVGLPARSAYRSLPPIQNPKRAIALRQKVAGSIW